MKAYEFLIFLYSFKKINIKIKINLKAEDISFPQLIFKQNYKISKLLAFLFYKRVNKDELYITTLLQNENMIQGLGSMASDFLQKFVAFKCYDIQW